MTKRRKEKSQGKVISASANKMQKFLERRGIASSKTFLDKHTTIKITGVATNGEERLLVPELREKYGSDNIELEDSFQTLMPFISKGTIIIDCGNEKHYEEYEVYDVSDTKFSLKINDYFQYGKTFALMLKLDVKSISKIAPIYTYSYKYESVIDFFINPYKETIDTYFTPYEKNAIIQPFMSETHKFNIIATISNIIAIFRSMNYLKNMYEKSGNLSSIYSNIYYKITNWDGKTTAFHFEEIQNKRKEELLKKIINKTNYSTIIPPNQTSFLLKELIQREKVHIFRLATGFVYESGLIILEQELQQIASRKHSHIEMIIGSLQHFDSKNPGTKIDRATVQKLNELMETLGIEVYTYQPSFYHGKYYYLQGENKGYVIIGSSNVSSTAFNQNYELDIIYTFDLTASNKFVHWFFHLQNKSKKILKLEPEKFKESCWECENNFSSTHKNFSLSLENIYNKVQQLTDEDKKYRLSLWLEHNPTYIEEQVSIEALKNYIMLVYDSMHLVVFESFIPGNAYYIFRYDDLNTFLSEISVMTKREMSLAKYSIARKNHIQDKEKLKQRIDKLFIT